MRGIHRSPVNSPHKGQWRGAFVFSLICAWINAWVNNRKAGNLGLHRAHYDVTIMWYKTGGYILWRLNVFALNYKRCNYVWGIWGYKAEVKKPGWLTSEYHDAIKWQRFQCYWRFVSGMHRSLVDSLTKDSGADLWCFLWSAPEQTFKQKNQDAGESLPLWRHCGEMRWICAAIYLEYITHL